MTKSTKFNLLRYQELLAKTKSSTKTGKEYFRDPEILELLSYESSVENQIFYHQKNDYLDLIQKYLDERIPTHVFLGKFLEMRRDNTEKAAKILKNFEELSTFWIEPGVEKFFSLFGEIDEACLCVFEFGLGDDGIPEDKFRNLIQKIFSQMEIEALPSLDEVSEQPFENESDKL
jgi:hypothetical protein